jgi:hypothetical protein
MKTSASLPQLRPDNGGKHSSGDQGGGNKSGSKKNANKLVAEYGEQRLNTRELRERIVEKFKTSIEGEFFAYPSDRHARRQLAKGPVYPRSENELKVLLRATSAFEASNDPRPLGSMRVPPIGRYKFRLRQAKNVKSPTAASYTKFIETQHDDKSEQSRALQQYAKFTRREREGVLKVHA